MAANLAQVAKITEKWIGVKSDSKTAHNPKSSVQGFHRTLSSYWKKPTSPVNDADAHENVQAHDHDQNNLTLTIISNKPTSNPLASTTDTQAVQGLTTTNSDSDPDYESASVSVGTEWADAVDTSEQVEHDSQDILETSDLDSTLMETWSMVVQKDRSKLAPTS